MFTCDKLRVPLIVVSLFLLMSCSLVDDSGKRATTSSHIITPSHYYTTAKAKDLSDRYKETLERLIVNIVRNPKTGKLQFANNIVSSGGIGFFTHSASKSPDERYLEVVLGVPEVFDESMDFSIKVDRLFSEYGGELLSILCGEPAIHKDPDVSGYGLNLSWRSTARAGRGSRITLERAVIYFSKEDASRFLNRQTSKEATLSGATVFAVQGDGRASRIAFRPLQPGAAALAPENKGAEKPSKELKSMIEPPVKEKDLAPKEAATTPAKSARETITKAAPSRPDSRKLGKEIDSYPEKKVEKKPALTVGQEPAKQKRAATPSQSDQQVASLPSEPKPEEKTPAGLKKELVSRPEPPPQKKEKGDEPRALAPRSSSTDMPSRAEKTERPPVPSKVERKLAERDQPLEKKAEKQSDSKPPPSADRQIKVFHEKNTSGQLAKEPVKEPAQGPIKTEAKPSVGLKTEVKAQPEEPRKMQGMPVSPAQTKRQMEEKLGEETARENTESLALAKKKYGLDQGADGYVIQVVFPQKAEAERWSGILNKQGYRVSMTSVGREETVRLRVGAFPSPAQAKNHLQQLEKQGLKNGVVLQVIQ